MKTTKKIIAFTLAFLMLLSLSIHAVAFDNPYEDVSEGDWYFDAVMTVAEAQVMVGTDETHFSPDADLTRGMMATILWRLDGAPEGYTCTFSDVAEGNYYYTAVGWAKTVGLVSGVGNNRFAPEMTLTREQMATMLYNYAARRYSLRRYLPTTAQNFSSFYDSARISTYAVEPIRWLLSENGLHYEGNILRPGESATRAEVAAGVVLFLDPDNGLEYQTGKSAYELAVENGYNGTVQEWLASLVGPPGASAYEIAVSHGYQGTEESWLASLSGKSAYEIAVDHGFTGTEEQWLESLHGEAGVSVTGAQVNGDHHLIITLSDGTELDAGYVGVETQPAEPPVTTYTVTFVDYDGTVLKTQQVEAGGNATPPANPTRPGYTFSGWSGSYTNVQANVTITATYTQNSAETFTVTFFDYDGTTVLATRTGIPSGGYAAPPADPTKEGATFLGWSGRYANVAANSSVTAIYSDNKNVLIVESATGSVGSTITILVTLDGAVKTCAFDINIMWDPSLELVSYDDDLDLSVVVNTDLYENGMLLNWSDSKDKTKERDVIELTFQIKNTSKQAIPIELTVNSIKEVSGENIIDTTYSTVTGIIYVN